ncbi:MAG: lipoyl(octanoyl) transferase LipB [Alcanivoracaceae bacterium]|nr:lipoyl(octanoyl) transferase LipB [Alcanivoracaceae bacterium]
MLIRRFDSVDYQPCWQAMKTFSDQRDDSAADELWVLEHPPVFTQGQAGKAEHVLAAGDIPVVQTDRGGQVTYHGPGQTVVYVLFDLKRMNLGTRVLVNGIEQAIIDMLADEGIHAERRENAPGVYVAGAKIASLGLRIRKGRSYHGLSLNRDMDLSVFQRINPCGYAGQPVTSLSAQGSRLTRRQAEDRLLAALAARFDARTADAGAPPDWYNPLIDQGQDRQ